MSQFTRVPPEKAVYNKDVYYEYKEFISKNNQHRFKDVNIKNKVVKGFALPGNNHCIVKLLDKYLSLLPPDATHLYMRAKEKFSLDVSVNSYTSQRVGINSISSILPELSKKSGIPVRYTNHSLRATAITRMFNAEVEEKVIAEISGYRSLKAQRSYEQTSVPQQQNGSSVINTTVEDDEQETKSAGLLSAKQEVMGNDKLPSQALSGTFNNCTYKYFFKVTHYLSTVRTIWFVICYWSCFWVIPCQINKEFWVTYRILTKLGVFVVPMVLTTHTNF